MEPCGIDIVDCVEKNDGCCACKKNPINAATEKPLQGSTEMSIMAVKVSLDRWEPWIKPMKPEETCRDAHDFACGVVMVEREKYNKYLAALAEKIAFESEILKLAEDKYAEATGKVDPDDPQNIAKY